jgi:hypothetical protein
LSLEEMVDLAHSLSAIAAAVGRTLPDQAGTLPPRLSFV